MSISSRIATALFLMWTTTTFADNVRGSWSTPFDWPLIAIHAALTIDGRVLTYGTDGNGVQSALLIYDVWDPASGLNAGHMTLPNTTNTDLFCSSQVILPRSGDIFLAGGDIDVNGKVLNIGNNNTNVFKSSNNTLTRGNSLNRARWYSSSITLTNGDTYIQGGTGGEDRPEVRDAAGYFRLLSGADTSPLQFYFPRNFVVPDGRLFGFDTRGRMYFVNPDGVGAITLGGQLPGITAFTSSAVMFEPGRILQFGGPSSNAYVIDVRSTTPVVSSTAPLSSARQWVTGTVLPDGRVLATGGSAVANELTGVNNIAEIWNPATGAWTAGSAGQNARLYHSTALLLPDATVLVLGGGAPGPLRNLNGEIYSPSYLFDSDGAALPRPTIAASPAALNLGEDFSVQVTGPNPITRVTLVKTGSVSHSFNFDQRFIELPFTSEGGVLAVRPPSAPGVATPGYYMLFVIDSQGVPSVGRVVRMNILDSLALPPAPPTVSVADFTLNPLPLSAAAQTDDVVTFTANVSGAQDVLYSWFFDDGTSATDLSSSASITHTFARPGIYYVNVTALRDGSASQTQSIVQTVHLPVTARKPAASTNILFEARGTGRVWVVNQDNDSVTVIDAATNVRLAEIAVGSRPRSLALAPNGRIWVANKGLATVSVIDPTTLAVVQTIGLPFSSQPFGIAFSPDGTAAFAALEATGVLIKLDPVTGAQKGSVSVGPSPRQLSISADGKTVYVSRFISPLLPGESTATVQTSGGGEVVVVDAGSMTVLNTIVLHVSTAPDSSIQGGGLPNYLGAPVISPDGLTAWVPSKQDNVLRGTLRNGLGLNFQSTVRAVSSRIALLSGTEDPTTRIDHDNSGVASAVAFDPNGNFLFVALESSREVAVVDAYGGGEILRFDVGRAPQGLVIAPDGRRLYVNNFMDRTVGVFDLGPLVTSGESSVPPQSIVKAIATDKLGAGVLKGKQFFYDARDPRLSRDRYLSCASCHNDGGQDGRVWDFTGQGEGLRNTIALTGRAGGQGLRHWSANFDETQDFEGQIRALAGGTGLMTDAQFSTGTRSEPLGDKKAGLSADLDALAAYVGSLAVFAKSPKRPSSGALTAAGQAGQIVFRNANCAQCHSGTTFTDSGGAMLHDIGTVKSSSGLRLGGPLAGIDTPTLRDVWATAPYLHDGSAATLSDAIGAHTGVSLSSTDRANLVAFVEQIGSVEPTANIAVTVDTTAPSIPPSFAIGKITGRPRLTWTASTDNLGVAGYAIYRSTNGSLGAELVRVTAPNWTDTSAAEGVLYTYALRAYDVAGNLSATTALLSISAYQAPTAPAALTAALAGTHPQLRWTAATDNVAVAGYIIYRSTKAATQGAEIARTPGIIWTDASALANVTYTYSVKAYDAGGYLSARSPFATIKAN